MSLIEYKRGDLMKKVVICAINSKYIHSTLAAWYIKAYAEVHGEKIELLEFTINESFEKVLEGIKSKNPDTIMFSTYIWNKKLVLEISKRLKEENGVKILLGGPEVSYNAKEVLECYPFVDYVISGEGEKPCYDFVSGVPFEKIDGFCYRKGDEIVEKSPHVSAFDPVNPYTEEYFERLNGRITYIETSRGCPYRCAFCLSGRCGGVRFFDLEESKKNIIALAQSGTQTVKFIDRTFNADRKRAREIFKFIIENYDKEIPKGVCFHFEIEGELLEDETFEVLKKAPIGLFQFEIGLQSFNEQTLESINRRTNIELLCENIKRIVALGNIHTHIDLIIGLPYENIDSFKKSFNKAYGLKPHMLQVGFLKLLHGADMREKDVYKNDFIDTPPYEILSNQWLNRDEINKLHLFEDVFEKMYNSARFSSTCDYLTTCFENPFDMFMDFAGYLSTMKVKNTLDEFTKCIFEYFSKKEMVDVDMLRDKLVIDRLATNRMGALPEFLKIHSSKIKKTLNKLEENEKTRKKNGIKRAAAILQKENKLVYVDYVDINLVTKRYMVNFTEIVTE